MGNKLLCSLALASVALLPSPVSAETLHDAVMKALEQHPTIEAAQAVEKRIQAEKREEWSGFFPEVNASATGGRIFGDNSTTRGLVTTRGEAYSYLWEGNASITQPLFDGMQTFNRVDAASARLAAQEYSVTDTRQNLALRAAQAYLNVLRAREALYSIENYRETLNGYQKQIKLMVDEGAADEAEAAQAKNIALLLEDSLAEFQGQVEAAEAEYIEIVGSLPEDDLEKPLKPDISELGDVDDIVEHTKQNHPLLKSAKKELEAAGYDAEAQEGMLYPEIDGELSYLKRDQREEIGGEVLDKRAVLRMNWSFSLGGAELARIRQSKADYSEALANMQSSQREIIRDVRRAYSLYETVKRQSKLLDERLKITENLFDTYKVQFEGARVSLLQLMQTENQKFNTELEAINTYFQYLTSHYTLLASMGDLLSTLNLTDEVIVTDIYPKQGADYDYPKAEIVEHDDNVTEAEMTAEVVEEEPVEEVIIEVSEKPAAKENIYPEPVNSKPQEAVYPAAPKNTVTEMELTPIEFSDEQPMQGIQITEPEIVIEIEEEPLTQAPESVYDAPPMEMQKGPPPKEQIYPVEDYPNTQQELWPAKSQTVYP